jgi:hypothetical protein
MITVQIAINCLRFDDGLFPTIIVIRILAFRSAEQFALSAREFIVTMETIIFHSNACFNRFKRLISDKNAYKRLKSDKKHLKHLSLEIIDFL